MIIIPVIKVSVGSPVNVVILVPVVCNLRLTELGKLIVTLSAWLFRSWDENMRFAVPVKKDVLICEMLRNIDTVLKYCTLILDELKLEFQEYSEERLAESRTALIDRFVFPVFCILIGILILEP